MIEDPQGKNESARGGRRPYSLRWLIALLVLQGLSGVVGGAGLVGDPSGGIVRIPLTWLEGSPFADYRIPGWILLTVLGIGPLGVAFALARDRAWALTAAGMVGAALLVWIGVEILLIGYHATPPLQLFYLVLGAMIITLAGMPSAKRYFGNRPAMPPTTNE